MIAPPSTQGLRVASTSLAFVFPGQGSQSVGMLADLPGARAAFDEASVGAGVDLWDLASLCDGLTALGLAWDP